MPRQEKYSQVRNSSGEVTHVDRTIKDKSEPSSPVIRERFTYAPNPWDVTNPHNIGELVETTTIDDNGDPQTEWEE